MYLFTLDSSKTHFISIYYSKFSQLNSINSRESDDNDILSDSISNQDSFKRQN